MSSLFLSSTVIGLAVIIIMLVIDLDKQDRKLKKLEARVEELEFLTNKLVQSTAGSELKITKLNTNLIQLHKAYTQLKTLISRIKK